LKDVINYDVTDSEQTNKQRTVDEANIALIDERQQKKLEDCQCMHLATVASNTTLQIHLKINTRSLTFGRQTQAVGGDRKIALVIRQMSPVLSSMKLLNSCIPNVLGCHV
jgi:hypothetical protein